MSRPLRYIPDGGALVEITINMIQGRYLLRPDKHGRVNELVLGVIGCAQRLYQVSIVGISVLSSHAHILAIPEDASISIRTRLYLTSTRRAQGCQAPQL